MNLRLKSFFRSNYFIGTLLTLLIFTWMVRGKGFSIYIPWLYAHDGILCSVLIKSFLDTGSFWTNSFLGYPGIYQLYDFPLVELANDTIIAAESLFSHNYAVVLNVFYFITFLLTMFTSLYTSKRLGLNKAFSLLVSVLFVFAPYHLYRGEGHLFLSAYYAIPIYLLLMMIVALEDEKSLFSLSNKDKKEQLTGIQKALLLGIILFLGGSGVYYAYFACYFIFIASIYGVIIQRNFNPLIKAGIFIGVIILGNLITIAPSIVNHVQHGPNLAVAHRGAEESELYGLKIIQLLLPSDFSGFSFMHKIKEHYFSTAMSSENRFSALGIAGSVGFLFLLFSALFSRISTGSSEKIRVLATLNLSAVLLATIGGLGTLVAYAFFPTIRGYNRISIFILYFSLIAIALLMQSVIQRFFKQRHALYSWIVVIFCLMGGIYDQTRNYVIDYESTRLKFENDASFIQQIETKMPRNSAIFQLPYIAYPESPPVYQMANYDPLRAYLHSHQLRWSAGAMKGRPTAQWQERTSKMPVPELLKAIISAGFTGIYIDRNGYEDRGQAVEEKLINLLHVQPLNSSNEELLFFDIQQYINSISTIEK